MQINMKVWIKIDFKQSNSILYTVYATEMFVSFESSVLVEEVLNGIVEVCGIITNTYFNKTHSSTLV